MSLPAAYSPAIGWPWLSSTRDEIKEVIMQSAIYCGIPAANATFHLAESVWDELGVESLQG